ncbi:hypothetical protein BGL34_02005 [Fructilactobacillus lindneri]|uniref:Peptidase s24-like protein n=2 Tax=Fructilactobacillus lindneri TaxID=53444 RepID=A0A0R2K2L5_9LACO|nr:S24 family peptidase [Fructilactobacillus lindneri]ANZ58058.1 hypothetical protein AYR60_04580 [Fructilactobacillus lindneri]ANZ59379.1 hypothetical protein AYR59_04835 [Fructilactobacillus lindneri]KRN80679.1 peptidase s24-like protein [Fructilactobacillus lindneri DSM 20690 = JCM 11027]POG98837.1 hypothetical protein BGL31_02595 [Fructilactobacillus lindneri]POH03110.1 hypothetical protein BGL33_04030 [Fructilactobacillus lindneri]
MNSKNNDFGIKIKSIRNKKGFSVRQTALQAKMSSSYLSQIENGLVNIPKPTTLLKLANGLRISKTEIFKLAGLDNNYSHELKVYNDEKMINIPVIGEIACGTPIVAQENIEEYLPTIKKSIPNGINFYLKCRGNSMLPTIPNGAYVLIHQQYEVENGSLAAVLLNDNETTLKRIQYQGDEIILIPDNHDPKYHPIILNEDNPGKIIGKVIQMQVYF